MPVLAALLSTSFGALATLLAARLSIGLASAIAFVAVAGGAYVAVKAALAAVSAGLAAVVPVVGWTTAGYFMPANLGECLTAILLADAIRTSWDYWRQTLGVAVQLAKG
jgi:3-oxoacyl-[acyl-carrier-protein] synthase III